MKGEHVIFQTDGTRYDLTLVHDPYGGIIVIWTTMGYVWRWYEEDYLKDLTRAAHTNNHDAKNIFDYLEANHTDLFSKGY